MKLPNSDQAVVSRKKLTDYLLSETHPEGRSKAKFFRGLGFNESNLTILEKLLIDIAKRNEVLQLEESEFGKKYSINGLLKGPSGKIVKITTVWVIEVNKPDPRLVTAYPA